MFLTHIVAPHCGFRTAASSSGPGYSRAFLVSTCDIIDRYILPQDRTYHRRPRLIRKSMVPGPNATLCECWHDSRLYRGAFSQFPQDSISQEYLLSRDRRSLQRENNSADQQNMHDHFEGKIMRSRSPLLQVNSRGVDDRCRLKERRHCRSFVVLIAVHGPDAHLHP